MSAPVEQRHVEAARKWLAGNYGVPFESVWGTAANSLAALLADTEAEARRMALEEAAKLIRSAPLDGVEWNSARDERGTLSAVGARPMRVRASVTAGALHEFTPSKGAGPRAK